MTDSLGWSFAASQIVWKERSILIFGKKILYAERKENPMAKMSYEGWGGVKSPKREGWGGTKIR